MNSVSKVASAAVIALGFTVPAFAGSTQTTVTTTQSAPVLLQQPTVVESKKTEQTETVKRTESVGPGGSYESTTREVTTTTVPQRQVVPVPVPVPAQTTTTQTTTIR